MNPKEENELLKRKIVHLKDDIVAQRYGIGEIERLAHELGKHYDKLIKKHIDGEDDEQLE